MPDASTLFTLLAVTLASESVVVLVMLWKKGLVKVLVAAVLVNLLSHPLGAYLYYVQGIPFWTVEVLVILLEAVAYRLVLTKHTSTALVVSIVANLTSIAVGRL
jgi:hypothetical protein